MYMYVPAIPNYFTTYLVEKQITNFSEKNRVYFRQYVDNE